MKKRDIIKQDDKNDIKLWVNTWKRAGKNLDKLKNMELQLFDYKKNQHIVDDMLQLAYKFSKERKYSGLVEQQKYFIEIAR
ncbi:MAG: hypothetical protein AB1765_10520 [Candidatus Hydrogenedentota bacterium]